MEIMTKHELTAYLRAIKPTMIDETYLFVLRLIEGENAILKADPNEANRELLLHNLPLYHEVVKFSLYNSLMSCFTEIMAKRQSFPLSIDFKKGNLQLATMADGTCYPIVSCMFFDRFKQGLPFYDDIPAHVACVSMFSREMYSDEERLALFEQISKVSSMLKAAHPVLKNDPLINAGGERRERLLNALETEPVLNYIINTCSADFLGRFGNPSEVLSEKEYSDGSCTTYRLGPEILVKKFVDKV